VLGVRVVHRNYREAEGAVAFERLQPDDARGRLFHSAEDVAELLAAM